MTFEEYFSTMKEYFENKDFSGFGEGLYSYQFNVTGSGEGIFYLEIRSGTPVVEPFDFKGCLCSFTADSGILSGILTQGLSPVEAYSTGRLRLHGDTSAAIRLADALELHL